MISGFFDLSILLIGEIMGFSRSKWIGEKIDIARQLDDRKCGGSYAEGILIISAAISAIAAEVWPGTGKDKKRFVELVKDYCVDRLNPTRISVPLLIEDLHKNGNASDVLILQQHVMNYPPGRVLTGNDVDRSEVDVLSLCKMLDRKEVRRFSYAAIFYEEVRSGYVHQYRIGAKADPWSVAATGPDEISYGNWLVDPHRHIHFPLSWITNVAASVAEQADVHAARFPQERFLVWWLDG